MQISAKKLATVKANPSKLAIADKVVVDLKTILHYFSLMIRTMCPEVILSNENVTTIRQQLDNDNKYLLPVDVIFKVHSKEWNPMIDLVAYSSTRSIF